MSTHEITAADCSWAEVHFSDVGEARAHLDELISTRQSLQSLRAARQNIANQPTPWPDLAADDLERIDRAIQECKREECELQQLIADCAMDDLFDLI